MTSDANEPTVAWRELFAGSGVSSLALVCLGVWLHAADGLLVSTTMPAIIQDIGGTRFIPWTVALYEIGSIVAGAACGLTSVRFGVRLPMTVAALLFALGCVISSLAIGMDVFLVGRLFQGLGGGGLCLLGFNLLGKRAGTSRLLPIGGVGISNRSLAGLLMVASFTASTIAIGVYGPYLSVNIHGTSALVAGCLIALEAAAWTVMAFLISGSTANTDRRNIAIGLSLVFVGILVLSYSMALGPLWGIAIGTSMQGAGFGLAWTFILRRFSSSVDPSDKERVMAAIPTMQRIGFALGAAYVGIFANSYGLDVSSADIDYSGAAIAVFLASIPLAMIGVVAALRFLRNP